MKFSKRSNNNKHLRKQILYPGIRFDINGKRPISIRQPLELDELKLIVKMKCNIRLRSPKTEQIYQIAKHNTNQIKKELDKYPHNTIIRLENSYPYNLKPNLQHWVAWTKGYTWNDLNKLMCKKQLPFLDNAAFYWINDPKFRSISTIPHYHLIYKNKYK